MVVDEEAFLEEWKSYYKNHTLGDCEFMTERDIFIARIQTPHTYGTDSEDKQIPVKYRVLDNNTTDFSTEDEDGNKNCLLTFL